MRTHIHKPLILVLIAALSLGGSEVRADGGSGLAAARSLGKTFSAIAKEAAPAVVNIRVEQTVTNAFGKQRGQGSGFFISADGLLLTNHHVVGNADKITVHLKDGRKLPAKIVGSDKSSDVALLRVDAHDLPYLQLGDSDAIEVGEWVLAIGSPFGLTQTVTHGIVSAKRRNSVGITDHENFIQTDAAINPGNSGGPLLNLDGEVIGINSAIISRSGASAGIGFAIPVNLARKIKDQLLQKGKVVRGYLGVMVQDLTPELADSLGIDQNNGALISEVSPDSPAHDAGLREGDVIIDVDGKKISNTGALRNAIGMLPPGTQARLSVLRDGKEEKLAVTLGNRDAGDDGDIASRLGLDVMPLDEKLADRLGRKKGSGIVIRSVKPGSTAAEAGLLPGHVVLSINRKSVRSPKEFHQALAASKGSGRVLFRVHDGRHARFVVLTLR